jgi:hypothetical protein
MHRTTGSTSTIHRRIRNRHRGMYRALREAGATRRQSAWVAVTVKRARAGWALRHPVLWTGDRHLRRAFRRAGAV